MKWWSKWRAHRQNIKQGKAFLRLPHDKYDPECVFFDDGSLVLSGMDSRCPSCNPQPVHYLRNGAALHAFFDALGRGENTKFTDRRDQVTCSICLGVLAAEVIRPRDPLGSDHG